jgi:transcriptional regulator with PAS, ATPase and Fis domain
MALSRYSWPGNIRELENIIGHACMMTEKDLIDIGDLPEYVRSRNDPNGGPDPEQRVSLFPAAEAD